MSVFNSLTQWLLHFWGNQSICHGGLFGCVLTVKGFSCVTPFHHQDRFRQRMCDHLRPTAVWKRFLAVPPKSAVMEVGLSDLRMK